MTLKHASPAQVVGQVLGGYTMKNSHPALQPAVVGVHVLDVKRPIDSTVLAWIDGPMGNSLRLGKVGINPGAVATKNCISLDQRQ